MLALLYLIVFGSIIALNCYLWLLTRVSAQKVTTYALVNPVVALILGAVVLNERITFLASRRRLWCSSALRSCCSRKRIR